MNEALVKFAQSQPSTAPTTIAVKTIAVRISFVGFFGDFGRAKTGRPGVGIGIPMGLYTTDSLWTCNVVK
ncbi:MAG: hypothetical protein H7315_07925 [Herminiimonas sp.]|nr:hypothetical protein [Herminiimonas sp.]